ncbi:serine hydrolase [Rhizosphaericola mali]|uniref:Serine hydrolase n=1 Tax=Rhizosphaericola mali TaxID=2545455 RepID=A0A5P2G0A8_9BACT|nr:serine hydrolase [Rhizosphaericola mali]QES89226.1 serine hydrolase [Rhizosphaericola mali]
MKKIVLLFLIFVQFKAYSQSAKINFAELDLYAQELMKEFNVPGMAYAVVRNDSIVYAKGFGVREFNKKATVDAETASGIGSISKSFTALTLGILVGQGKLNWDDKVRKYLPDFELYDPYVSENFTIRDLLTHRSGLKQVSGGMLLAHSDLSREEIVKQLKYLKPVSGFRDKPAYQNVMYLVASEIVKVVSGMSWDEFLKQNVFEKLDMKSSSSLFTQREATINRAHPHVSNSKGELQEIVHEKGNNVAPLGFVFSSVNDMGNYMRMLLNDGKFEGKEIIAKSALDEIFTPQIHFPVFPIHNEFTSYGFGWWLTPAKGHKIIDHSGGLDGMTANLVMIKDLNIGIIATCNTDNSAPLLLTWKLLEQVINDSSYNVHDRILNSFKKRNTKKQEYWSKMENLRVKNTKPSFDLNVYAGTYHDNLIGDIYVKQNNNNLEIIFPNNDIFHGKLSHWQYDTFLVDWNDIRIPNGFITFNSNINREITGITIEEQNLLDVDFTELDIKKLK